MKRILNGIGCVLVTVNLAQAQTIEVPGDYSDLQTAIDAAPPDATILVHGGHWFALTLQKPVRIVGDPMPHIWGDGSPVNQAAITLDGPGSGNVILSNLDVGVQVNAGAAVISEPGIQGGGFDGLFVYDSHVSGPVWDLVYNYVFPGATGIDTSVPLVWIERSTVQGSDTEAATNSAHHEFSNPTPLGAPGGTGIVAPGVVVLLESTVRGGDGDPFCVYASSGCTFACPAGDGGNGVVCQTLIHRNSVVQAGAPSTWFEESGVNLCCTGSRGQPMIVQSEFVLHPKGLLQPTGTNPKLSRPAATSLTR